MSEDKNQRRNLKTTTLTESAPEAQAGMDALTPEEERVVRLRHGLSEGDDYALKFGLGASQETLMKLANLEQFLVEKFAQTAEVGGVINPPEAEAEVLSASRKSGDERED